jgi:hypothetical protein
VIGKSILVASGVLLALAGVLLIFLPQESIAALGVPANPGAVAMTQLLAAALLALGFINWNSRANIIGGIYSRPLALGNFLFYGVGAISLGKSLPHLPLVLAFAVVVLALFAIAFGWLLFFADPVGKDSLAP